ncbi:MAG: response regulator transcription factor [Candidatus Diapherotrites archaeon]|nr:response regulator transcription factor [Candidatus Diapherotrites archaeon]
MEGALLTMRVSLLGSLYCKPGAVGEPTRGGIPSHANPACQRAGRDSKEVGQSSYLATTGSERSKIILMVAEGKAIKAIAEKLGRRPATVSRWRTRILAKLDGPPGGGETVWTARRIASELGDVSICN